MYTHSSSKHKSICYLFFFSFIISPLKDKIKWLVHLVHSEQCNDLTTTTIKNHKNSKVNDEREKHNNNNGKIKQKKNHNKQTIVHNKMLLTYFLFLLFSIL